MSQPIMLSYTFLVFDYSGSMGSLVSNSDESKMFTRIDFAKHGSLLCVNSAPEGMRMAIVKFDNSATMVQPPILTNEKGKDALREGIKRISPSGSTDIMKGLILVKQEIEKIINLLPTIEDKRKQIEKINVMAFTDGVDDVLTINNVASNFHSKLSVSLDPSTMEDPIIPFKMELIGFGTDANNSLLLKMAELTKGNYVFCPTPDQVGTVFGRSFSRTYLGKEAYGIHCPVTDSQTTLDGAMYDEFCQRISTILIVAPRSLIDSSIRCILSELEIYNKTNELIMNPFFKKIFQDLFVTVNDQVLMAVSSQEIYDRWGKGYILMMAYCLKNQFGANYKDLCLQNFGTLKALAEYERIEHIYKQMPALIGSRGLSMSQDQFNQRYGSADAPCFHPHSNVAMWNKERYHTIGLCELEHLLTERKDEYPIFLQGPLGPVELDILVKIHTENRVAFCPIPDTRCTVTKGHPVKVNGKDWCFPEETNLFFENVSHVYNIVLKPMKNGNREPSVLVDDTNCICWAHGITDHPVLEHDFFGTELIVKALKEKTKRNNSAFVVLENGFGRNAATGWVDRIL